MQREAEVRPPPGVVVYPGSPVAGLVRGFRFIGVPALVVASAAAWFLVRGIDHRFISFSDGAYMYAASIAAAHGIHELYRNVAMSLPPGSLLGAALLWRASPHIETIRWALAASGTATALLTYRVARTRFGLAAFPAVVASILALAGPVHAQFVGLEGEAVITPLALLLALALGRNRRFAAGAVLGLGFFFKLTWAPFFVCGVFALASRLGWRKALSTAVCALAGVAAVYAAALRSFGWSAHDLAAQLLLAEAHSGSQLALVPGLALATIVLWWPFLMLAPMGLASATPPARFLLTAGAASGLYMVKQGTFFNVLDPLEPFLAVVAVAGACALWQRRRVRERTVVLICGLGAALHIASVSSAALAQAIPLPLGAAIVDTDNEDTVDRLARIVADHSRPDQPVLVNPLFALVAHRHEALGAADWFILHSLGSYCASAPSRDTSCNEWSSAKVLVRRGRIPVVSIDSNVTGFDRSFRRDVGVASLRRVLAVDAAPLKTAIYVRQRRGP